ncbi:hypothetical protein O9G_001163 [Rozella allomycis CSF55]|uniref:Uncharacterized protein n=1 Tax=Rozella allomycis (strain CSF55) TaxID=988480 RepID=A0A075AXD9_ROZAC|nr:hypothetical protein O9G_001163 [Rozella allomycis CSF55]|eukprot:EPZ33194.1 hypothetical protein O9G_001163 [Rozella allomycis CSF55]
MHNDKNIDCDYQQVLSSKPNPFRKSEEREPEIYETMQFKEFKIKEWNQFDSFIYQSQPILTLKMDINNLCREWDQADSDIYDIDNINLWL